MKNRDGGAICEVIGLIFIFFLSLHLRFDSSKRKAQDGGKVGAEKKRKAQDGGKVGAAGGGG